MKSDVPNEIWTASNIDENYELIIGTTIDFKCPNGLKLSHDNDGFHAFDDKYTILCSTREIYDSPKGQWVSVKKLSEL